MRYMGTSNKEARMDRMYVTSADIETLLKKWAAQKGFILPGSAFFQNLREEFCRFMATVFEHFEMVPEEEIREGLQSLAIERGAPILSLERVYCKADLHLDISRTVGADKEDRGFGARPGFPTIPAQLQALAGAGIREVTLVDDVIFKGELTSNLLGVLSLLNIRVCRICAGVGIQGGVAALKQRGVEVACVRTYEHVIDQVCERDFYPGIPLSGRLLEGAEDIGFPYLLPFGDIGKWASIPEHRQHDLSEFCLQQTSNLFKEIEKRSDQAVLCSDVGRGVVQIPADSRRFVLALEEVRSTLAKRIRTQNV
jgi:hypothetical protein